MNVYLVKQRNYIEAVFADQEAAHDYAAQIRAVEKVRKVQVLQVELAYGQLRYPVGRPEMREVFPEVVE